MRLNRAAKAMVLPTLLLLATVLMVLTAALVMSSSSSLRVTTFDQQSDVALYAAETGLSRAAEEFSRTGEVKHSATGTIEGSGATYVVRVTLNDTDEPMPVPGGPHIPPSTLYLLAEGTSSNKQVRRAGALFRVGLGVFQVGVVSDTLQAKGSKFDAYDSAADIDPTRSQQPNRGILASNRVDPAITDKQFQFHNSRVEGGVYTAPATLPADQIAKTGNTLLARESTLSEPITINAIEVPDLPQGEATGGVSSSGTGGSTEEVNLNDYSPGPWQMVNGAPLELKIFYEPTSQSFGFTDIGQTPPINVLLTATEIRNRAQDATQTSFPIGDSQVYLNFHQNPPTIGFHDSEVYSGFQATSDVPIPPILQGAIDSQSSTVHNPDASGEGEYGSVIINDSNKTDLESGVYVLKRLEITGSGQLALPEGKKATIYVTEHLSASGTDALVNSTRLPPNLKIFYTGTDPIVLAGGSQSYFTLVAPKADVQLIGPDVSSLTRFFGALAGRTVHVENAHFHYDTATEGIGTGTDGSSMTLLSRQRL